MFGIINRSVVMPGLRLLPRWQKVGSNIRDYVPWSTASVIKPLPMTETKRGMSKYVKPISRRAKNLQTSDGIPLSYDIIYNSFEWHTISQYGSAALSILYVILGSANILFNYDGIFPDLHTTMTNLWISVIYLYFNAGTAVISYKSPVRIYYNKETGDYKAVFNAFKPFNIRVLEFRRGMVEKIPPLDILMLYRFNRYKIKEQELYMYEMYFRYPSDFYEMFDKIDDDECDE